MTTVRLGMLASRSLTPVTVTVWVVFQVVAVKVSGGEVVATVLSPVSGVTVTGWVGWLVSLTVYVAVEFSATVTAAAETVRARCRRR